MKLDLALQKFGLTGKEMAIYLAVLELGSASVQKIAQKAGIVRSTAYEVLEQLRYKNLVTTFLKKKARYYSAEDPNQIIRLAEDKVTALREVLPELNAINGKSRQRPTVRFYQGKEGMKMIFEEILAEADELLVFVSIADLFKELGDYFYYFVKRRVQNKISSRVISFDSELARERQKLGPKELRVVRILSKKYDHHGLIYVWKNKIAMFSFVNDFEAIVTESKELAETQKSMFNYLWDSIDE